MQDRNKNNSRIARNTLVLYVRMALLLLVGLYTSRVILNALGVSDYGIYNVVGGFVTMFQLISWTLSSSTGRFLTYELGRDNQEALKKVFSTGLSIQFILCGIVILVGETVGLWFVNTHMNFPVGREFAANWVFQLSLFAFCLDLICTPYNADIIAHEKMTAFAYISILEAILKLLVAFLVLYNPFDRLIYYAVLIFLVALIIRFVYVIYCNKHFEETIYHPQWDRALVKELFSFAGWSFVGASSSIFMTQGVNMLMNIFFGVVANAARGIATTIENIVNQFSNNFLTAVYPQITKSYASNDLDYMHMLICRGSKFSYYLVFVMAVPAILEAEPILMLWLGKVPEYTVVFVRLTIAVTMLSVISNTLITSMLATGNIKRYQIIVGGLGCLVFPIVYVLYKIGAPAYVSYIVQFSIFLIQLWVRLYLLKDMIKLPVSMFVNGVLKYIVLVSVLAVIPPIIVHVSIDSLIARFFVVGTVSVLTSLFTIYICGLTKEEKAFVDSKVLSRIKSFFLH